MDKRKIGIVIIAFALGFVFYLYMTASSPFTNNLNKAQAPEKTRPPDVKAQILTIDLKGSIEANTEDYEWCTQFNTQFNEVLHDWSLPKRDQWDRYFDQGYTFDEITFAVEHFSGPNFAKQFRIRYLRKDGSMTTLSRALNQDFNHLYPENKEASARLVFRMPIPNPAFNNYKHLALSDKRSLLKETRPTTNDIAYFMLDTSTSDDDLNLLLQNASYLGDVIEYDQSKALSLLDLAVSQSSLQTVELLLKMGVEASEDLYLPWTMERALSRLYFNSLHRQSKSLSEFAESERIANEQTAAAIIQILQNMSLAVRFELNEDGVLKSLNNYFSIKFDQDALAYFQETYALDLLGIERQQYKIESRLIDALNQQRQNLLVQAFNTKEAEQILESCRYNARTFNGQWLPLSPYDYVNSLTAKYENDTQIIEGILADDDPLLLDIFRAENQIAKKPMAPVKDLDAIYELLNSGKIQDAIKALSKRQLSDANKNWLVWTILMSYQNTLAPLFNSDLWISAPAYSSYGRLKLFYQLKSLQALGLDTFGADTSGKTLLHYAVRQGDPALIEAMHADAYPYTLNDNGEDPLHLALNINRYVFSSRSKVDIVGMVSSLMRFEPLIDEYHLSRMALLALRNPSAYRSIVDAYPQLRPTDQTVLPVYSL